MIEIKSGLNKQREKTQIWQILGQIIFDRGKLVSFKISYADLDQEILNDTSRLFQMRESNLERLIDFKNIKGLKLIHMIRKVFYTEIKKGTKLHSCVKS